MTIGESGDPRDRIANQQTIRPRSVTGPEQHAATVERLADIVRQFLHENEMGSHGELGPTRAALDELVALAGRADKLERERATSWDAEGSPSYRFHLERKRAEAAEARADEFERDQAATAEEWRREQARADELQRERDTYAETIRSFWAKLAPGRTYEGGTGGTLFELLDAAVEARREADQLRAALEDQAEPIMDERFRDRLLRHVLSNQEVSDLVDAIYQKQQRALAALAGVQTEEQRRHGPSCRCGHWACEGTAGDGDGVQADNKDSA